MPARTVSRSALRLAVLLMVLGLLPASAAAATKTWFDGSGQWDVAANWSPPGLPQAGDTVNLTQSDATSRTVTYYNTTNPTAVLSSLEIDATGTGTMTLDMPNNHALSVTSEYVGYSGKGAVTQSAGTNNAATLYLGYSAGATGTYTLTGGTLSSSSRQYIGYAGKGAMIVRSGGQASGATGYLGYYPGSTGTTTVTGTGSTWTNSGGLYVGGGGSGTLNVEAGGAVNSGGLYVGCYSSGKGTLTIQEGSQVSNTSGYLGYDSGSTGTATVTGAGSKWTNSDVLYIGRSGNGALSIEQSSQVSNTSAYLGYYAGSSGTATVTGAGSKWTCSDALHLALYGTGTLNIEAGGQVSISYGYIGEGSGSSGTATVTGAGSKWTHSGDLPVGFRGSGALIIQAGGEVSNTHGSLGELSGSSGTVTVTGAGSKWTNGGDLYVGREGSGTLTVADGGLVTAGTLYASLGDLSGDGTITATEGAVLDANLVFDGTHGLTQTLCFGTGGILNLNAGPSGWLGAGYKGTGTLRIADGVKVACNGGYLGYCSGSTGTATVTGAGSKWTNSGSLRVGYEGNGTLNVEAGGEVSSFWAMLGNLPGSTCTVTVTGAGSKWTNSNCLYVAGDGRLTVADGGLVSTQTLFASISDLLGDGTISAQGVVLDADLVFDGTHGTAQTLSFGTGGTLNLSVTSSDTLGAGYKAVGSLRIADGVTVASAAGYLGFDSGSNGTATVTGPGSTWANSSGLLYVGYHGRGTLNIQAGAQVSNTDGCLGLHSGSTGTATVTGAGSTWTNSGGLCVGHNGIGTLNIQAGGQVSNTIGYLAHFSSASQSAATVTGVGSKWTNSGTLYVGYYGSTTLNIEAGGQVSNTEGWVGYYSDSTSKVTVTGDGSKWTMSDKLRIGNSGTGTLTVADGGKVTAKSVRVNSKSAVRLRVSGNGMLLVGNDATTGSVTNNGAVRFYADAFLAAGTYNPISEYMNRTMAWSGTGAYKGYGGTWNSTAKTFSVAAATALTAGSTDTLSTGERLLFTDPGSGRQVGASFGSITGSPTFSASPMSQDELAALVVMPGFEGLVLSAWDFDTNFSGGDDVLLSFAIGPGAQDPGVWRCDDGVWTPYAPALLTYDSGGVFSFTVTDFSGYAVTAIPEPATLALLACGLAGALLARRARTQPATKTGG